MVQCAVFASGGGSNFQALIDKKKSGDLHAELAVLIVNNSDAFAAERARKHGIPVVHCAPSHFPDEAAYTAALQHHLDHYNVELIICAGYMKKFPVPIVTRYKNRILNIHPALLPAFGGKGMYGSRVHQAVLEYGVKLSGITVHYVDEEYDHGPVIFQAALPVHDGDTPEILAKRVLELEHAHFWKVVDAVCCGRITCDGRRVSGEVYPHN